MSQVQVRVSTYALQLILRLPEHTELTGVAVSPDREPVPTDVIVLVLDVPQAPEGTVYADPAYTRRTGLPDPVELEGFRYYRADGTEIRPEPARRQA